MPSPSRLRGYLVGRSAVLVVLLVFSPLYRAEQGGLSLPLAWFFTATAASFCLTLASAMALQRGRATDRWTNLQLAWDVLYATLLVYISGGAFSPFSSLYPLAIIGGAILLFRKGALIVATASSLTYGLLVDLQYFGLLAPLDPVASQEPVGETVLVQLLFNLVAFYAVALLSGYLAEELRRTGQKLREAEAEVLDLEHLKESILHSLGSGLAAVDSDRRILFHNSMAEQLLERAGIHLDRSTDLSSLFDLAARERNEVSLNGGRITLGYSVSSLFDRNGTRRGSLLIFQDLTNIKRLEEDLRRADRLAAVGRLAAGLAHEIRNPLASLCGSVEVLRSARRGEQVDGPLFEIILKETERLNGLVTNFLHYARPGQTHPSKVELQELVDEVGFFFSQGEGKKGFRLDNRLSPDLTLAGDRDQLEQLLLNLFRNSVEASPGAVTVAVEGASENGTVRLSVSDDGPGMPEEIARQVFEPFFTSKEDGTGLGLATVHRVAENHRGTVRLETAQGRGSRFLFEFPAG